MDQSTWANWKTSQNANAVCVCDLIVEYFIAIAKIYTMASRFWEGHEMVKFHTDRIMNSPHFTLDYSCTAYFNKEKIGLTPFD